jgi:hypothetical protein
MHGQQSRGSEEKNSTTLWNQPNPFTQLAVFNTVQNLMALTYSPNGHNQDTAQNFNLQTGWS